jgi:hypothetical protein
MDRARRDHAIGPGNGIRTAVFSHHLAAVVDAFDKDERRVGNVERGDAASFSHETVRRARRNRAVGTGRHRRVKARDLAAVVVGDVGRERGAGDAAEGGEGAVAVDEGTGGVGQRSSLPSRVRADVSEDAAGGGERREPTLLQHENGDLGAQAGACCQDAAHKRHERHQNENCDDG